MAAALAYYTVFALPPLLILIIMLVGLVWDPTDVQRAVQEQMGGLLGSQGAELVQTMIAKGREASSGWGAAAGVMILIAGATGLVAQLQNALNKAWRVKPDPKQSGIKNFITKRVLSFAMVLGIAFLLLVSLLLSTAVSALGDYLGGLLSNSISETAMHAIDAVVSFLVTAIVFAAMFKWLPDAEIAWRDLIVGAVMTAALFTLGRTLIGLYLGKAHVGSAYGAAGSLAIVLIWLYYSSMIVLLGAEFTQAWARVFGSRIEPEPGAVRAIERTEYVRERRAG